MSRSKDTASGRVRYCGREDRLNDIPQESSAKNLGNSGGSGTDNIAGPNISFPKSLSSCGKDARVFAWRQADSVLERNRSNSLRCSKVRSVDRLGAGSNSTGENWRGENVSSPSAGNAPEVKVTRKLSSISCRASGVVSDTPTSVGRGVRLSAVDDSAPSIYASGQTASPVCRDR